MKISRLLTRHLQYDMGDKLWNSQTRWSKKDIVLAFLETDNGYLGVGEAWTSGGSPQALIKTLEDELAPRLIGKDPFYVNRFWADAFATTALSSRRGIVSAALGAVDTALWDVLGKATGTPLYRLLGAYTDEVRCYASAGLYGLDKAPADLGEEMAGYAAQGFSDVKMKVGGVALAEDLERVQAARDAIGPAGRLMVDANYALNVPQALRMASAFAPYDIYWLEAPLSPNDIAGQAKVNAHSPIPVCGNETEYGRDRFRDLMLARAVEYVQFDIAACGGISEGRRIADLAGAFHLPCTLHASSSAVLLAASLHLAATLPNLDSVEYHMLHQWLFDRLPERTFQIDDRGRLRPPPGAGIGIELDYADIPS